jgi:8-oxo-dGTP diphosphatase
MLSTPVTTPTPVSVATDAVIFGLDLEASALKLLLIERGIEPFRGRWALPGGFLQGDEDLDACVRRELVEETGIEVAWLEQLYTFGAAHRDPRGRVVSVAYWGIVRPEQVQLVARTDARRAHFHDLAAHPALAFDHEQIVQVALKRLRSKLHWQPVGVWLLPLTFTLVELERVYEILSGEPVDRGNFRKKIRPYVDRGVIAATGEERKGPAGRPAALYRFDRGVWEHMVAAGEDFEV